MAAVCLKLEGIVYCADTSVMRFKSLVSSVHSKAVQNFLARSNVQYLCYMSVNETFLKRSFRNASGIITWLSKHFITERFKAIQNPIYF